MKAIKTRYGASVDLNIEIDDVLAQSASLYVGLPGETPVITKTANFIEGVADVSLDADETEVPLNTYKYQVNVTYSDGRIKKFPEPKYEDDDGQLPEFIVSEALDQTEVTA